MLQQHLDREWRGRISIVAALLAAATLGACVGGTPETPEASAERVESAGLGLAIEALPANFGLVEQTDEAIILQPIGVPGTVEVTVGAASGSVNLIDEVNAHAEEIRTRAEGVYQGQSELIGPLGTMYLSRGLFRDEAEASVEEYRVIALHPTGDRPFYITYRYPAGDDTKVRGEALIELVGEIAPFMTAAPIELE